MTPTYSVVIPTVGRDSLATVLASLAAAAGPPPREVVVVDDRHEGSLPALTGPGLDGARVLRSGGRGPAAARNVGWRATDADWVCFLDDDVRVGPTWRADLAADLTAASPEVAGVQGRIEVPLPRLRRPTDWERGTARLASARWITADMAYRRSVLADVGGFDERFPRAYREDTDLALRVLRAGHGLDNGGRRTTHPVRDADRWASVRQQAGNADDVLMRRLHGPRWRRAGEAPPGRLRRHLAIVTAAMVALVASAARQQRVAGVAAALWAVGSAELLTARALPGPRTCAELGRLVVTSAAIPPAASAAWLQGVWRHRHAQPWPGPPAAVLFDRDGTLVRDVPYNGDPARVEPMPGAACTLRRLRAAGIRIGVVTNQSGVGRGVLTLADVDRVNGRVDELLGPFDTWAVCPHLPTDGCGCRKPLPGLIHTAAASVGVPLERCAVVGDIGADIEAARAAGVRSVLVPTAVTRPAELAVAGLVAADLQAAADLLLGGRR